MPDDDYPEMPDWMLSKEPEMFSYPLEEFETHFSEINEILRSQTQKSPEIGMRICRDYFSQFQTDPFRLPKMERFLMICSYMEKYLNEFNEGDFGVVGSDESMINKKVIGAVHFFYSRATDEQLFNPPTPDDIKNLLKK